MTDHVPALRRNKLLPALPPPEPSQLRPHPMRVQRVNGQGLQEARQRIKQVFCVEQSFASMVTVADTDSGLLRTAAAVPLVEDDELVRECLSERLTDRTKESGP
jgi:hypothetical protein